MKYSVKIGKKNHELPAFTLKVEHSCSDVVETAQRYETSEVSAEDLLNAELKFLTEMLGNDFVVENFGEDVENIDIHEVDNLCTDIVLEYQRPAREKQLKQLEETYAPIKGLMADKSVSTALNVVSNAKANR